MPALIIFFVRKENNSLSYLNLSGLQFVRFEMFVEYNDFLISLKSAWLWCFLRKLI